MCSIVYLIINYMAMYWKVFVFFIVSLVTWNLCLFCWQLPVAKCEMCCISLWPTGRGTHKQEVKYKDSLSSNKRWWDRRKLYFTLEWRKNSQGREVRLPGEGVVAVHCMAETFAGILGGAGLVTGDRKQPSGCRQWQASMGSGCVLTEGVGVPVQTGHLEPRGYPLRRPQLRGPRGATCSGALSWGSTIRPTRKTHWVAAPQQSPLPPTLFLQHPLLSRRDA